MSPHWHQFDLFVTRKLQFTKVLNPYGFIVPIVIKTSLLCSKARFTFKEVHTSKFMNIPRINTTDTSDTNQCVRHFSVVLDRAAYLSTYTSPSTYTCPSCKNCTTYLRHLSNLQEKLVRPRISYVCQTCNTASHQGKH